MIDKTNKLPISIIDYELRSCIYNDGRHCIMKALDNTSNTIFYYLYESIITKKFWWFGENVLCWNNKYIMLNMNKNEIFEKMKKRRKIKINFYEDCIGKLNES